MTTQKSASPFPGMDPYLEDDKLWPGFQHQLVHSFYQILLPGLMDRYRARVAQRDYVSEALFTSVIREEHHEQYIEIRQRSDGKLVTIVDVVSPANKSSPAGRSAYLEKRREGRNCKSSLVDIDLIMGQPLLDYSREGLPEWDYAVTVNRSTQPERYEIYTATLEKRLPRFRLPLASGDRDTVVDLQAVFTRAFELGNFGEEIDYRCEPDVPLTANQYRRVAAFLKWPTFSHEEIAAEAYQIWEEEGRPQGRDREHWKKALERLRGCAR